MVKNKYFIIIIAGLILSIFSCTSPIDPSKDFDQADLTVLPSADNRAVFAIDDTVTISVELQNPHLMNYITVYFDTLDSQVTNFDYPQAVPLDTFSFKKVLKVAGTINIKFSVTLTNGEERNDSIIITVIGPLTITSDLVPVRYAEVGKPCTLSVGGGNGTALEYSWFKVGKTDMIGKGNPLVFTTVSKGDSGSYYCVVNNADDTVVSSKIYIVTDSGECIPILPNSSLNNTIREVSAGPRPKALCPQPGFYDRRTIKINGKIRILIE